MKKTSFIIMITALIIGAAISPKKSHADASVSMNDGFVIEADRVEGVMGIPGIINGETATQKNKLMLRLTFSKATIYGLTITKVLNTPNGPVTIHFKSTGPVELTNMAVNVTRIEFSGIYLPNKLGELGMKNIRLVSHKQTADEAILPALVASLEEQGTTVDTTSDSDENLTKQAEVFKKIIGDSKNGKLKLPLDELYKILQPNKDEEKSSTDQNSESKTDNNPLDEINKVLQPSKTGKSEDSQNNSTVSEDKDNKSVNNEQSSDKADSNTTNNEEKADSKQDNQQQTEENNSGAKKPTSDSSGDTTSSGDTKQSNGSAEEPAPSTPSSGDSNSGSTNETKHGGLLDLLKSLFP